MSPRTILRVIAVAAALAGPAMADPLVTPDQSIPDSGTISPITAAFVEAAGSFNGYLQASDQLAGDRASRPLRSLSAREATSVVGVIDELQAWAAGIRRERFAEAHAPSLDRLGPLFGRFAEPVDIVVVPADLRQRGDFRALERLEGRGFDELFVSSHVATLRQLENSYVDYIKNGDDQVLRALSVRDLPRVRGRLSILLHRRQ